MVRKEFAQHTVQISGSNNPAKQISVDAYNLNAHKQQGILGFDSVIKILSTDAFVFSDTLQEIAAQTGVTDDLATITATDAQVNDLAVLFADAGDTITVKHGIGNISLGSGVDKVLSENIPLFLMYRGTTWYEFIGDVFLEKAQILKNKTIDADLNTITNIENADIKTAAAIAYSKLNLTGAVLNTDLAGSISPSKITGTSAILGANTFTGIQIFSDDIKLTALKKLYLDGGGDSYLIESAANVVDLYSGNTNTLKSNTVGLQLKPVVVDGTNIHFADAAGGPQITIANDATSNIFGNVALGVFIYIYDSTIGEYALIMMGNPTVLVAQSGTGFTVTKDTAGKVNIYLDSADSFINKIQNKSGVSHNFRVVSLCKIV